jgi:hypothetical protein
VKDRQREALAGLAVGGIGEGPTAEVDDVLTSGVAVKDLHQEEVDRRNRVEDALPPGVLLVVAGGFDRVGGQAGGEVLAQSAQDGEDAVRHGRAPCGSNVGLFPTTKGARRPSRAQEAIKRSV